MKTYNAPQIIFYLINPFISLIYSFFLMINKSKDCVFFFALSLATIIIYFPIMYDTSSNFYAYFYNQEKGIFSLYNLIPRFLKDNLGLDYYYFIFLSTLFIIYSFTKVTKENLKSSNYNRAWLYWVLITLFTLTYRDVMDLNRNTLSMAICFFYILYLRKKTSNYVTLCLFIYFSISIHTSAVIVWLIYLLSNYLNFRRRGLIVIICTSLLLGFLLPVIMNTFSGLISSIDGPLAGRIYFYLYGDKFGVQEYTGIGQVLKKSLNLLILVLCSFYSVNLMKKNEGEFYCKIVIFLCCSAIIFFQYVTFFERINLAVCFVLGFLFIQNNKSELFKIIIVSLVVFRSIYLNFFFYFPIMFYDYDAVLKKEAPTIELAIKPFYTSSFILLDMDNGYSDKYLLKYNVWGH